MDQVDQVPLEAKFFSKKLSNDLITSCPNPTKNLSPEFVERARDLILRYGGSSPMFPSIVVPSCSNSFWLSSYANVVKQKPQETSITSIFTNIPPISGIPLTKFKLPQPSRGMKSESKIRNPRIIARSKAHKSFRHSEVKVLVGDGKVFAGKEKEQIIGKENDKLVENLNKKTIKPNTEQDGRIMRPSLESIEKDVIGNEKILLEGGFEHDNEISGLVCVVPEFISNFVDKGFTIDRRCEEVVIERSSPDVNFDMVDMMHEKVQIEIEKENNQSVIHLELGVSIRDEDVTTGKTKEQIAGKGKEKLIENAKDERKLIKKAIKASMEQDAWISGPSQGSKANDVVGDNIILLENV